MQQHDPNMAQTQNPSRSYTATMINELFAECHARSAQAGWWTDPISGLSLLPNMSQILSWNTHDTLEIIAGCLPYVIGTKIGLIHSEISEALEGYRTNAQDDKLPNRPQIEVELADAIIRIGDLAAALELDVGGAIAEKMAYNATRPDHQVENRRKPGGKKF